MKIYIIVQQKDNDESVKSMNNYEYTEYFI